MRKIILLSIVLIPIVLSAQEKNLIPFQQNEKWGYADNQGRVVIRPQFSEAHNFSCGLARVEMGGVALTDPVVKSFVKMGFIDEEGHWVIQSRFKYYFPYDFSEGLVPFRKLSKGWGYMDTKGKIVIGPRLQWAGNFAHGIAPVLVDGGCAQIRQNGEIFNRGRSVPRNKALQSHNGTFLSKHETPPCP